MENDVLGYHVRFPGPARGSVSVPPAAFTASTSYLP
jgi:hypothetical protein